MVQFRCRHNVFSAYFGDDPPVCKNKCDVCKDKKVVQSRISEFEMHQSKPRKSTPTVSHDSIALPKYDDS